MRLWDRLYGLAVQLHARRYGPPQESCERPCEAVGEPGECICLAWEDCGDCTCLDDCSCIGENYPVFPMIDK